MSGHLKLTSVGAVARSGLLTSVVGAGMALAPHAAAQTNGVDQTEVQAPDEQSVNWSTRRLELLLSFARNELRAASLKKTRLTSEQVELTQERAQLSALGDQRRPADDVRLEQIENRLATLANEVAEVEGRLPEISDELDDLQRRLDEANGVIREEAPDDEGNAVAGDDNAAEVAEKSGASIWLDGKRRVQEALVYLGGYNALIDGDFGPRTAQAIRVYQGRQSLDATGILTGEQEATLLEQAQAQRELYGVTTFADEQFGYQLSYPSFLLSDKQEISTTERRMATPDGESELRITVIDAIEDFDGIYDEATATYEVQYRRKRNGWFVVAGLVENNRIIYDTVRKADAKLVRARLSYPANQRDLWSPFAVIMFNTLITQPTS